MASQTFTKSDLLKNENTSAGVSSAFRIGGRLVIYFLLLHSASFFLFDLGPDAAARQMGWQAVDVDLLNARRESLGLSGPWNERYVERLTRLAKGDFGKSLNGGWEVAPVFASRTLTSLPLWLISCVGVVTIPLLLSLGYCSSRPPKLIKRCGRVTAFLCLAPQFLTVVIIYAIWKISIAEHVKPEFRRSFELAGAVLGASIYPAALVFLSAANTAQSLSRQTFVMVYIAKGLSWWQIRWRILVNLHVDCRAVIYRSILAAIVGSLFGELIFGIDGVGRMFVEALRTRDLPVIEAWVLMIGVITISVATIERNGKWN